MYEFSDLRPLPGFFLILFGIIFILTQDASARAFRRSWPSADKEAELRNGKRIVFWIGMILILLGLLGVAGIVEIRA